MPSPPKNKKKNEPVNEDWEAEIAAYDAASEAEDREFRKHNIIIRESGNSELTVEENEVFALVLKGISCSEIAEQYGVEVGLITGLVEIIRAKLSISE
jgi:DNA-binding CsgD family transcriptional regulator